MNDMQNLKQSIIHELQSKINKLEATLGQMDVCAKHQRAFLLMETFKSLDRAVRQVMGDNNIKSITYVYEALFSIKMPK